MVSTRGSKVSSVLVEVDKNGAKAPGVENDSSNWEGEDDQLVGGNDSSDEGDASAPSKKRARSDRSIANTTRKKYVRGKQGGLKGLMKMPVDIFTEIAYLLNPGDLVALSRSSKFFRNMLLQRSAVQMWRRAESNVGGLPPCPPDMCEPQYAALVFSKYCTLCGANATAKPDSDLRVRLCPSCRDTKLLGLNPKFDVVVNLVFHSAHIRPKKVESQRRTPRNLVFSLKHEVEEVYRKQRDLRSAGNEKELAQWEKDQRAAVLARTQHAYTLRRYLYEIGFMREDELASVKEQRKANIIERLKALGWTEADTTFQGLEGAPWRTLVEAPKPLTDRIWNNLLPKLTPLLEANRERNIVQGKNERRIERRAHIDRFLLDMRYTAHPFRAILEALGVPPPPPPVLGLLRGSLKLLALSKDSPKITNPFPKTRTALTWDLLNDLSETEMPIQAVGAKLEERKTQIEAKVLEWRTTTEQRLVEKLESGVSAQREDTLVVECSTDSAMHLSRNARILLRADTIFKRAGSPCPMPCYYPEFVSPFSDCDFVEYVNIPNLYADRLGDTTLHQYERFTEAERVAKTLLRALGVPNVTLAELELRKRRFMCGGCITRNPKTWKQLVEHYLGEHRSWDKQKDSRGEYPVRHPITYRNMHDLEATDSPKSPVRLCEEEEAEQLIALVNSTPMDGLSSRPRCHLCEGTGRSEVRLSQVDMLAHMRDVHDVAEAVEGLHYGMELYKFQGNAWHKKWDAYHDARESGIMVLATAVPPE